MITIFQYLVGIIILFIIITIENKIKKLKDNKYKIKEIDKIELDK